MFDRSPSRGATCRHSWACATLVLLALFGCRSKPEVMLNSDAFNIIPTEIEYPDTHTDPEPSVQDLPPPNTLREPEPEDYWELTLEEVIRIALQNSAVMRQVGARVLDSSAAATTIFDPAVQQTDPRTGEEAALSDFDAQFTTSMFINRNERSFNNPLFGGGATSTSRTAGDFNAQLSKTAATGSSVALRSQILRDADSIPLLRTDPATGLPIIDPNTGLPVRNKVFDSSYDALFEAEFRHPLLQGGGIQFNRIAGPNSSPGNYNGILISRVRTDIALADFESAVRNFLEDVEQTYWQLYFAYRDLDARTTARNAALESWRAARVRLEVQYADILDEALARDQYYQFQTQVAEALSGVGTDASISAVRPGVFATERELRRLMGIAINDRRVIRPAQEPSRAELVFDWGEALNQAMQRRVELRRQKWEVKRREMELAAARNFLKMRLDFVGRYRWRGFGDDLLGNRSVENGSAFRDLWDGNLQGYDYGLQLSTPVGNRIGHAAVRNAELALVRERTVLREQERQVAKELSDAFADLDRAFRVAQVNYNRAIAARDRLRGEQAKHELGDTVLQFVLDAQSSVADAQSEFFRSLVDYNLAAAKIHHAKGTYLDYVGINLAEGPWSPKAIQSARKESRRYAPKHFNYCVTLPPPMSRGRYEQRILPRTESEFVPTPAPMSTPPTEASELRRLPGPPSDLPGLPPSDLPGLPSGDVAP